MPPPDPREQIGRLSNAAQQKLGLPDGFKAYSPFPFSGMNLQSSPIAMDDKEFLWCENFLRLGDGNLRTAWDVGTPLYTATGGLTIVFVFFYTIGTTYYAAVFLSDGSAVQVDMSGNITQIGPATTFYNSVTGYLPACQQWGSQWLLISNKNTVNDYWAWDGGLLYTAGTAAPNGVVLTSGGMNYSSQPTVVPIGGTGSGLVLGANIYSGSVASVEIFDPGINYQVGDVVELAFTGGGSDNGAILVADLTPTSVSDIIVEEGGTGYTSATVTISGGGSGASVVSGYVTQIGRYLNSLPTLTLTGGGGSGATAVATGYFSSFAWNWTGITITGGGAGYTSAPTVNASGTVQPGNPAGSGVVTLGSSGSQATATATVANGMVTAITLTSKGSGYLQSPLVTISGNGTGATARALLTTTSIATVAVINGGTNYTAAPTLTIVGGGGTGATATANMSGGAISSVTLTDGGSGYISQPGVEIQPSLNNAAYGFVNLMPYGVSGSAIETYASRVWLVDPAVSSAATVPPGGDMLVSAPDTVWDFATSDGGVIFTSTDGFLQTQYVGIHQSNGYLYTFGDGSISVVSGVTTSVANNLTTTTFSYQTVDPQIGLSWRNTIQDFSRTIVFGNNTGAFGLYGGAATKISAKLQELFTNAIFPPTSGALVPSAATATLFDLRHYLMLMTVQDPDTLAYRNVMVTWNEREWTISSQSVSLNFICTQKLQSLYKAWGTDGKALYPLFQVASSNLIKRLDSKFYGADNSLLIKDLYGMWMQALDNSSTQAGINMMAQFVNSGIGVQNPQDESVESGVYNVLQQQPAFQAPYPAWPVWAAGTIGMPFLSVGVRLTSNSPDFTIGNLILGYTQMTALFGSG